MMMTKRHEIDGDDDNDVGGGDDGDGNSHGCHQTTVAKTSAIKSHAEIKILRLFIFMAL